MTQMVSLDTSLPGMRHSEVHVSRAENGIPWWIPTDRRVVDRPQLTKRRTRPGLGVLVRPTICSGVTVDGHEPLDITLDGERFWHGGQPSAAQVAQERVHSR